MASAYGKSVVDRRVAGVVDRLNVALQFTTVTGSVCHQVLHAFEVAMRGPVGRCDHDWLDIEPDDALALVRALIPYVEAARQDRPVECTHEGAFANG